MRRRDFNASLLIAGVPLQPMLAQIPERRRTLAVVVIFGKREAISETGVRFWRSFFGELRRLGHVEGRNLIVERHSAEGHPSRYADLARDVVSLNPDVIFLAGNLLARTFRIWTPTTPIVAIMADPLETGLVQSLARPGGYLTGVSEDAGIEIWGKRVQLLKEAVPSMTRLAYVGVQSTRMGAMRQAVESRGPTIGTICGWRIGGGTQPCGISPLVSGTRRADARCDGRYYIRV